MHPGTVAVAVARRPPCGIWRIVLQAYRVPARHDEREILVVWIELFYEAMTISKTASAPMRMTISPIASASDFPSVLDCFSPWCPEGRERKDGERRKEGREGRRREEGKEGRRGKEGGGGERDRRKEEEGRERGRGMARPSLYFTFQNRSSFRPYASKGSSSSILVMRDGAVYDFSLVGLPSAALTTRVRPQLSRFPRQAIIAARDGGVIAAEVGSDSPSFLLLCSQGLSRSRPVAWVKTTRVSKDFVLTGISGKSERTSTNCLLQTVQGRLWPCRAMQSRRADISLEQ